MPAEAPAGARARGFAPVAPRDARVLVLGSLPGVQSLQLGQYYAHPRNAFWRIMGRLVGAHPELPYEERCRRLSASRIGLWDVLASCVRPGSLDSLIETSTARANDFAGFFSRHSEIELIAFNGRKAAELFRRRVDECGGHGRQQLVLPSTSPAHAALSFERKLARWEEIAEWLR